MKQARQDVKVLLDGQGGDELYAGYLPYFMPHLEDLLAQGGWHGRYRAWGLAAQIYRYWGMPWGHRALARLIGDTPLRIAKGVVRRGYAGASLGGPEPAFFHPSLLERVAGREIVRLRPPKFPTRLDDMLYWQLRQQSIPALLHYEDRNSMAVLIMQQTVLLPSPQRCLRLCVRNQRHSRRLSG